MPLIPTHVNDLEAHQAEKGMQAKAGSSSPAVLLEASLKGIPGELRNRIYRLILVEDGMIRIWKQSHEQPGRYTCSVST